MHPSACVQVLDSCGRQVKAARHESGRTHTVLWESRSSLVPKVVLDVEQHS